MPHGEADLFSAYRDALLGLHVAHAWRGHGSAIVIEFGNLTPIQKRDGSAGQPRGDLSLTIQWSWRIEKGPEIVCGSWGNEELWEVWLKRAVNRTVVNIETFGRIPEVVLSMDHDLHILSFATTEGQPDWAIIDQRENKLPALHVLNGQLTREH